MVVVSDFSKGLAVHNQCIERLWRDLWCTVIRINYVACQDLEDIGALDPNNDVHITCLHFVMLPRLNWHLKVFTDTWDRNPIFRGLQVSSADVGGRATWFITTAS